MRVKKLRLILLFSFGFMIIANGQTSINSSGTEINGIVGSVSYSLGQLITITNKSESGSVMQGILIGYIDVILKPIISQSIVVYPNPAVGDITLALRLTNESLGDIAYKLFNLDGRLLFSSQISSNNTIIPTTNLNSGTYFLQVKNSGNYSKTLKIIKK